MSSNLNRARIEYVSNRNGYIISHGGHNSSKEVGFFTEGGNYTYLETLPRRFFQANYRLTGTGKEILYYCEYHYPQLPGKLFKYNLTDGIEEEIDLGIPDTLCSTGKMHIDDVNQTITLTVLKPNGLLAIVEIKDEY